MELFKVERMLLMVTNVDLNQTGKPAEPDLYSNIYLEECHQLGNNKFRVPERMGMNSCMFVSTSSSVPGIKES